MVDVRTPDHSRTWLQRIQEQSWEPEILISGIVLFALFQIPPLIGQAADFLDVYSIMIFSGGTIDESLSSVLLVGNYWLIVGFTTHLIGRSIWAAFVGLSYVYRDGIKTEKLKYDEKYKVLISKNVDYERLIIRLEKFCSRIFAISFLLFMCIIGVFFFLIVLGLIVTIMMKINAEFFSPLFVYIDPFLLVIGGVYFLDFVTLGAVKRIPYFNKVYYPFYRVMSVLTLAPLYRSIYYGFVTNHKSWKVGIGMFVFGVITMFMAFSVRQDESIFDSIVLKIDQGENYMFPGNYMNLAEGEPSKRMLIESDIIERNVAKIFLVQSKQFEEEHILKKCNYLEPSKESGINRDSLRLDCLKQFYLIKLNGEEVNPELIPTKNRRINRRGLNAYIDLSHLPRGLHSIELYYLFVNEDGPDEPQSVADIEFYKTVSAAEEKSGDNVDPISEEFNRQMPDSME